MLEQFLVLNGAWSASGGPHFWALSSGRPVWESAGRRPSYVSRRHASLVGMHLSGMRLLRARISYVLRIGRAPVSALQVGRDRQGDRQ
jgi:hypothetical protein